MLILEDMMYVQTILLLEVEQELVNVLFLQVSILLCFLLYPGLILIDYGHFQYPLYTDTCIY